MLKFADGAAGGRSYGAFSYSSSNEPGDCAEIATTWAEFISYASAS